jgi:hypothetical protein
MLRKYCRFESFLAAVPTQRVDVTNHQLNTLRIVPANDLI